LPVKDSIGLGSAWGEGGMTISDKRKKGDTTKVDEVNAESHPLRGVPTLEELVAQITPENRYEETDWGPPVGKEIW